MVRKSRSTAMDLISKKKARQATFEKRKKSLRKAAHELSTLCGVGVGMIVCNEGRTEAEVWPPGPDPVARMVELYRLGSGQDGMCKRVYGVAEYWKERREKVEEQIKKMRYAKWEEECKGFSEDQWRDLGAFLKAKIAAVREKITSVRTNQQQWGYSGSLEGSTSVCPDTNFWVNPLIQDQQIGAYNVGDLVEGFGNPYLESEFVPEIAQHHQNLAPYEAGYQNEEMMTMMMNGDDASYSEEIDNYSYFLNQNGYQNSRVQTEMVEKADVREVEPLMPYDMPNKEAMLQNWQGMLQMDDFPEWGMQAEVEPLMPNYDMPNEEMMMQDWEAYL